MKKYTEGYELKENEYLLKIRKGRECYDMVEPDTGFMTKLNKDGSIPAAFKKWGHWGDKPELPTLVIEETFRSGWKLDDWRFGMSLNWASLIHPEGFTVEVYLSEFLDIVKENTIVNGEIKGKFKWEYSKLVKNV